MVLIPGTPTRWATPNRESNVSSFLTADLVANDFGAAEISVKGEIIDQVDGTQNVSSSSDDGVVCYEGPRSAENYDCSLVNRRRRQEESEW